MDGQGGSKFSGPGRQVAKAHGLVRAMLQPALILDGRQELPLCQAHSHLRPSPSLQLQVSNLYPAAVYLIIWRQSIFDVVQALNCSYQLLVSTFITLVIRVLSENHSEYLNMWQYQRASHRGCMKTVQELCLLHFFYS